MDLSINDPDGDGQVEWASRAFMPISRESPVKPDTGPPEVSFAMPARVAVSLGAGHRTQG